MADSKLKDKGKTEPKRKRKRRRSAAKSMPPPISDTPENVARALFDAPPSTNKESDHGNGTTA